MDVVLKGIVDPQGHNANMTGRILEDLVETLFKDKGFKCVQNSKYVKNPEGYPEVIIKNAPYTSMYDSACRGDFLVMSEKYGIPLLRIESRWQGVPGSVDEKLAYLFGSCMNMLNVGEAEEVIIVKEGDGFKASASRYLNREVKKAQIDEHKISVLNPFELQDWVNNKCK